MTSELKWRLLMLGLLLFFWAVSLDQLTVFPLIGQDEPWIAAAPYKLATQGIFGSDLFTGYYGMERHHYQHLPAFHLLQAGIFRLAGVGVFQMRFLPVTFGLLLLPLTFAVGRQVDGEAVGLLAGALLLGLRLVSWGGSSGIPKLDIARINRYDIAVPVYGLAAFWAFNRRRFLLSGLLVGVSGLNHMYGLFWLPALGLVLALRQGWNVVRHPAAYLMLIGTILAWIPWLAYVASDWTDFLGQQRLVADRFDLFNARFYLENLLHEVDRYRFLDLFDEQGRLQLIRPGMWSTFFLLPLALAGLLHRARHSPAFTLAISLITQSSLFALLLAQKHFNYMIALWPLAVLTLAWGMVQAWRRWRHSLTRLTQIALLALILLEGSLNLARRHSVATGTTPYDEFMAQVAAYVPDGALVLGLQHYWLGLRNYPYRTWLLPLLRSSDTLHHDPLTLAQALDAVNPDVVLLDRYMGDYFTTARDPAGAYHDDYLQFQSFMNNHQAQLVGVVTDPDYGHMEVYWLQNNP
jgi:4-amino-4-deoxy-L-arabinose transferase-like glycosyltransferase